MLLLGLFLFCFLHLQSSSAQLPNLFWGKILQALGIGAGCQKIRPRQCHEQHFHQFLVGIPLRAPVAVSGVFCRLVERWSSWQLLWLLMGICTGSSALVQGFRLQSLLLYRRENATLSNLSSLYSRDKNHLFLKRKCLPVLLTSSLKPSLRLSLWFCSASKQKAGRIPGLQ